MKPSGVGTPSVVPAPAHSYPQIIPLNTGTMAKIRQDLEEGTLGKIGNHVRRASEAIVPKMGGSDIRRTTTAEKAALKTLLFDQSGRQREREEERAQKTEQLKSHESVKVGGT